MVIMSITAKKVFSVTYIYVYTEKNVFLTVGCSKKSETLPMYTQYCNNKSQQIY